MSGLVNGGLVNSGHALVNGGVIRVKESASALLTDLVAGWETVTGILGDSPDVTGRGNDLAGTAVPTTVAGPAAFPAAIALNGTTQYLSVASTTDLRITQSCSLAYWAKSSDAAAARMTIASKGSIGSAGAEYNFRHRPSQPDIQTFIERGNTTNTMSQTWNDSGVQSDGAWHHYLHTVNLSTGDIVLYRDGALKVTSNTGFTDGGFAGSNVFYLGAAGGSDKYNGALTGVYKWANRILVLADAVELYNAGSGLAYPF
jgi:hypothetical protein